MTDHYDRRGVSKSASANEIRQAYARLAKEKHPDRYLDPTEKQRAHSYFQDLTSAFNTLYNPNSRREYDASRERPTPRTPEEIARDAYERANEMRDAGNTEEASTLLRSAVHHAPNEAIYHHALGRVLARNRATARDAIQAFEKAIQLSPREAAYRVDLAALLLSQGLTLRAQKAAEEALRIAPRDPRVQKIAAAVGLSRS
jgi:curved DNA-binding protein CbpA